MKCNFPVPMYRDAKGITSSRPSQSTHTYLYRPCGYCINCRLNLAHGNAIRMHHEASMHSEVSFLTLTYSDDKLPPNGSLYYDHVIAFIKRLRERLSDTSYKNSLTFYRVGEYGDNFSRPHYHLILFGFDFSAPVPFNRGRSFNEKTLSATKDSRRYYKSSFLDDTWGHGFADVGDVDHATCFYVAKYVTKKVYGTLASSHYETLNEYGEYVQRTRELSSSSRKNPIGTRWIEKYFRDVYPHDYVLIDGKKYPPPRYYDNWLEKNHPDLYLQVKSRRLDSAHGLFPDYRALNVSRKIQIEKQKSFLRDGVSTHASHDELMFQYLQSSHDDFHTFSKRIPNA